MKVPRDSGGLVVGRLRAGRRGCLKTVKEVLAVIEQRSPDEITDMWYKKRMAPDGVKVYNPAFDVTDNSLITGIVTEYGIARPPFVESLKEIFTTKAMSSTPNP